MQGQGWSEGEMIQHGRGSSCFLCSGLCHHVYESSRAAYRDNTAGVRLVRFAVAGGHLSEEEDLGRQFNGSKCQPEVPGRDLMVN